MKPRLSEALPGRGYMDAIEAEQPKPKILTGMQALMMPRHILELDWERAPNGDHYVRKQRG